MDDFVIATKNDSQDHDTKVRHVLQKLHNHDLYLKPEKCSFSQQEVKYLGVIIGGGKVRMDPVKVKDITDWPILTTIREVHSFLGFCNFYCAFIPHFSDVAQPLNDLTCKNRQWSWSNREQDAFLTLKHIRSSSPILYTPDWTRQFTLKTDASGGMPLELSSSRNLLTAFTLLASTVIASNLPRRTMMSIIRNWPQSSLDSNVVTHSFLVRNT
jgi:Reverse transcriptase (RNA-dependent DNA polymerase)